MRTLSLIALTALLVPACKDDDDKADDTAVVDDGISERFAEFVNVTEAPVGNTTCVVEGDWIIENPDTSLQTTATVVASVEDFETGDEVVDAIVTLYYSDDATTVPDQTLMSDDSGNVTGTTMVCTPLTYLVSTDAELDETKDTYTAHVVYTSASTITTEFQSVSSTTYQVIPSLLGVSPDEDKGIVAGRVYGCDKGSEGIVQNAQVVVTDDNGNIPDALVVKYMVDEFPNRNQPTTSDDGLFVAINVPEGSWNVEAYVSDGAGGHLMIGATRLTVVADSINISSIYAGYGDGIQYPAACLGR